MLFAPFGGVFFALFCILGHKIGAVGNSIGIIVLIQLLAGVFLGTLFPRGNFYLLEDGRFTRHPCAQFEHMELWAHSLMIYYFQREIFTLWEATSSDYFPRGQIDHLELPIVIGSN